MSSLKGVLQESERKSGDLGLEIATFTDRREKELRAVTKVSFFSFLFISVRAIRLTRVSFQSSALNPTRRDAASASERRVSSISSRGTRTSGPCPLNWRTPRGARWTRTRTTTRLATRLSGYDHSNCPYTSRVFSQRPVGERMHRRSFIVDSNRVIIHSSFVHAQVREKIAGKLAGLRTASDALRAKHSAQDDERAAAADAAARLLAAKEETAKVRSERREGRRRRADAISSEIATCAVSDRALGELNTRLDQQREAFEDKQRDATSSTVRVFLLIFERAMRMTVFF